MTNMEHAMKEAGVKLPSQNQRIWQWLKDNGPHSVKDVASELKIGAATTQAAITVMVQRKMLVKHERVNHLNVRINNHYEALGKTYTLLPKPGNITKAEAAARPMPPEVVDTPAKADFNPGQLLADCTLAEMRQVYNFLLRIFK